MTWDVTWHDVPPDEPPPTLGVREPRKPPPPSLSGGAEAQLAYEPEPAPEAVAASARVGCA